jgi:hypothetical protein
MDQIKEYYHSFINWLPPNFQDYGWLLIGVAGLMVLLILLTLFRRLGRALFPRRSRPVALDFGSKEKLDDTPLAAEPPGKRRLTVEGVPVRLRLVVIAPVGKKDTITENAIAERLDRVLWGLGSIYLLDRPGVRIWEPQLSQAGFVAAFHRAMLKREPEGQPTPWILVAGQTPARPQPILLGLAMWGDNVSLIGRLNLEPGQWANVLRIQVLAEEN